MAKNDNLTDFMTDLADAIREAERPYIERVREKPDLFTDHMPQNVDNTPMYMGNWELGCYNCDTGEYIQYSQYEADGNWLTYDGTPWGNYSGFGVTEWHANYLDFGGNIDATHRPCICYTAPKAGRVKLSLTRFENVQDWYLSIYVNDTFRGNWYAGYFTQDEINTYLGNIGLNLSKGDVVRFVATRTGYNWHCKMVPAVQYEVEETINPQDFSDRVKGIPALVAGAGNGGEVYVAAWDIKQGVPNSAPYRNDFPVTVPVGKNVFITTYGFLDFTASVIVNGETMDIGTAAGMHIYPIYGTTQETVVNIGGGTRTSGYPADGNGFLVLVVI
jgi:hypothetical protein